MSGEPIRWGIISTANIARGAFLPALRAAGGGEAYAVGGRDPQRTRQWAADNGVEHALESYDAVIDDPKIDAIYVPTPNSMHGEWAIKALRAGKAVLCEKPLCGTLQETEKVLAVARESEKPLWEAFIFPFRKQSARLFEIIDGGEIGDVVEVQSSFQFALRSRENVRLRPELEGGALQDVGCYPIAFARMVMRGDAESVAGYAHWAPEGVDEDFNGILRFSDDRSLLFSCSMRIAGNTFSRVMGTEGEVRLTNPFHPSENDTLEIVKEGTSEIEHVEQKEPNFTAIVRHIHAVLRGEEAPQHLAVDEALGNAQAIDMLYRDAKSRS